MTQKVLEKNDASSLFNAFSGTSSLAWTVILKAQSTQDWNILLSFPYVVQNPNDFFLLWNTKGEFSPMQLQWMGTAAFKLQKRTQRHNKSSPYYTYTITSLLKSYDRFVRETEQILSYYSLIFVSRDMKTRRVRFMNKPFKPDQLTHRIDPTQKRDSFKYQTSFLLSVFCFSHSSVYIFSKLMCGSKLC